LAFYKAPERAPYFFQLKDMREDIAESRKTIATTAKKQGRNRQVLRWIARSSTF
jgi:hypothetical protein